MTTIYVQNKDVGLRYRSAGPMAGMKCTNLREDSDREGTWNDNYLCLPRSSASKMYWSNAGPISG